MITWKKKRRNIVVQKKQNVAIDNKCYCIRTNALIWRIEIG